MKKVVKFLLLFAICFLGVIKVNASDSKYSFLKTDVTRPTSIPASFKIGYSSTSQSGNSKIIYYNDVDGVKTQYAPIFKVDSSTQLPVYCLEGSKGTVKRGSTLTYKGMFDDPGIVHLIKNSQVSYKPGENYTVNQFATWFYMHEVWSNTNPSTYSPRYAAKTGTLDNYKYMINVSIMISDAAKKVHNNYKEPSMGNLQISSNKMVVENDYLISNEITVPLTGINKYKVSVDNGIVIDSNGTEKYEFKNGEKFRVKVNKIGNTTVNVTVTSQYKKEYVPVYNDITDVNSQDVLFPYIVTNTIKLSKKLKLTYEVNNTVEFSKVDATTGKELPGATLIIRDSNNKEIERWVSTNEVHKVKLNPGTYTLEEIIAPEGYILSTKKVKFTVKSDGTCDKVVMENEPLKEIEFSKVDATTGKELPGATLIIRDSSNKEIERWVSTNKIHKVKLNPGTYTLEEIIAPEGYILSTEKITFTVKEDGTCDKVVMENKPEKYVEFSKVDATTGKELPGATLIIRDSSNKEIERWVSTTEVHKVKLNPGTYTLEEIIAPEGYILSTEKITFTVKEDGTCDKVVMENKPEKFVEFSKVDATTGKELPGATLIIRDSNNKEIERWVSTNEVHKVKLNPGTYTLEEIIAPNGYELSSEKITFTVKEDGTCDKVVMKNYPSVSVPPTALNASVLPYMFGFVLLVISGVMFKYYKKEI